jgi:YD repeat-containing protein
MSKLLGLTFVVLFAVDVQGQVLPGPPNPLFIISFRSPSSQNTFDVSTFTYDERGNLLTQSDQSTSQGVVVQTHTLTLTYDAGRRVTAQFDENANTNQNTKSNEIGLFSYDAGGNLFQQLNLFDDSSDGCVDGVDLSTSVYVGGRLAGTFTTSRLFNVIRGESLIFYLYDDRGRVVQTFESSNTTTDPFGTTSVLAGTSFTYDQQGHPIEEMTTTITTFRGMQALTSSRIARTFDESGKLSRNAWKHKTSRRPASPTSSTTTAASWSARR